MSVCVCECVSDASVYRLHFGHLSSPTNEHQKTSMMQFCTFNVAKMSKTPRDEPEYTQTATKSRYKINHIERLLLPCAFEEERERETRFAHTRITKKRRINWSTIWRIKPNEASNAIMFYS